MSKIKSIVGTIKKVCSTMAMVIVFPIGLFLAFLAFGGGIIFALSYSFFGFPSKNAVIILSILGIIFIGSIIIFETYTWIRQLCCSHVWDNEDTPRVCIKCGKKERIWADGGYGRYD